MDAIAVALASEGAHCGAAPLGTSLTETQAQQLAEFDPEPIIATDADAAGAAAAERDYWLLSTRRANPTFAKLPDQTDPADLLAQGRVADLAEALRESHPLSVRLIETHLASSDDVADVLNSTHVLAASAPERWEMGAMQIAQQSQLPVALIRTTLASAVLAWNADPRGAAESWIRARCPDRRQHSPRSPEDTTAAAHRAEALALNEARRRRSGPTPT